MGYKITLTNGLPVMSFEADDTIGTDILLSVLVPRGAWFFRPDFGLPELPKKITPDTIPLIRQRFEQAVRWLLDLGTAKSIDVIAEQDDDERRVNVRIEAVQANDKIVTFETFVEVV